MDEKSGMTGDCHVPFCGSPGVRFPRATRRFETYTWAAGLGQATDNIAVFCTTHVPTVHPIVAAKMATTIDHISRGRFGMNLVMGWFTPRWSCSGASSLNMMSGAYGQEWLDFVQALWSRSPGPATSTSTAGTSSPRTRTRTPSLSRTPVRHS